ncbi:CHASE2 domain-containing protein [Allocoleopsis sp.]|uniref:CHASE2 domain-containing protein n=1 Tax=Allocoleopsis sp. TaxID=3088169 RepID=UPI002FD4B99F
MGKLVVLKLWDGSFEQGFPVTLQIGDDERHPCLETIGKLPPIPEIPKYYGTWATNYRRLGLRSRLEASVAQVTNVSTIESCCSAAQILRDRLNAWLDSEPFRPIREKLLEQLMPSQEIRLIIQTDNPWLRRLPWHLWNFCDRYPKAEIALSPLSFRPYIPIPSSHSKVRILAILGNSKGIDIQADRLLLEQLPNAEVRFLVEPQRQELNDELWTQDWDILFFAGHSSSHENGETGRIYLNQTDSLTIDQLRFAVKKAVEKGLKIAIFNSCDGLGLAQNLVDLQIPQTVVMREPVPDRVSQEFLKYFLDTFSQGESFYLAVREARERLQGLEDRFPCATWLPMIFQNPAVVPPTWEELYQGFIPPSPPPPPPPQPIPNRLRTILLLSVGITFLLLGIRHMGFLQPLELRAFDEMMRHRPAEPPDSRLLVVTVTEDDIKAQGNEFRRGSLSDRTLAKLLAKLESYQPRVIGLDIYRDFPVEAKYPELAKYLRESHRFIGVCQASTDRNDSAIEPPPEVPQANLGLSDVAIDSGGIVRRHLLAMTPSPASPCTPQYTLSTQVALRYLEAQGISRQVTPDGLLKLGKVVFKPLESHSSGYQGADTWGHQVLLNYRFYRSPEDFAGQVSVQQVLKGQINPNAVKDRVVFIGVTAPSAKDFFPTPYAQTIPGVVVHAQQVSQILSAVLDGRPLLRVWPGWGEALWIWGWSLAGGLIGWHFLRGSRWVVVVGAIAILYGLSFVLFIQGTWVPLVPAVLVLVFTSGSVFAYITWQSRHSTFTP